MCILIFFLLYSFCGFADNLIPKSQTSPFFSHNTPKHTQATCSTVKLMDKSGPVRNQTHGACYAYAAIELLNFGKPKQYSALHLAEMVGQKNRNNRNLDIPIAI